VDRSAGFVLLGLAACLAVVGLFVLSGVLGWFGRLPGDVRISGRNVTVFAPIVSMLVVSLVLSLVLGLIARIR